MTDTPPTPTPPEGWREEVEKRFVTKSGLYLYAPLTEEGERDLARKYPISKVVTRRVWVEPWREAE